MTLTFAIALPFVGLIGLALSVLFYWRLTLLGTPDQQIALEAEQIAISVRTFLKREALVLVLFLAATSVVLLRWVSARAALALLAGAVLSALVVAACAHVVNRLAPLAVTTGARDPTFAGYVAFYSAVVCGLISASFVLISLSFGYFLVLRGVAEPVDLAGFVLGATAVSLFYRLAGGVFGKSAELTASLACRVEPGLQAEDPRNPARAATFAGNQLGSLCGAVAELFEISAAAVVATILIASSGISSIVEITSENRGAYMALPILAAAIGMAGSLIALLTRRFFASWEIASVFRASHLAGGALTLGGVFLAVNAMEVDIGVFYAFVLGVVTGLVSGLLTEWYTSGPPVRRIAQASGMGSVTTLLAGITGGMQSTALPLLTVSGAVLIAYNYAGIYGIGIAAVGMLTGTAGLVTIAAFGPIIESASAMMRQVPGSDHLAGILSRLRLTGSATAAVSKSFVTSASVLSVIAFISAYARLVGLPSLDMINPTVIVGFVLGGVLPFFISDSIITSIGRAAFTQLEEVRRQFDESALLRSGQQRPDVRKYAIKAAWASIRGIGLPLLIAIAFPVAIGEFLGRATLGGLLAGALTTGMLVAMVMIHSGTAWENTRTYLDIERRDASRAESLEVSEIARLFGNPLKDACGPAVATLIRLTAVTALVIAPLLR